MAPHPTLSPRYWNRSAAVSSSTSRSTLQAPDAFELATRCGWSSTQPRSVREPHPPGLDTRQAKEILEHSPPVKQSIVTLDLEGVLVPEIWIAVAEKTGIKELRRTAREE